MPGATTTESSPRLPPDTATDALEGASEAEAAPTDTAPHASAGRGLGYRPALDGLRAVAVLAVIAYHDNYAWARGGFLGVDMFFVLSGFLITTLLVLEMRQSGTVRFASFWARRARRLLPALLLVVGFVGVFTYFVVVPWQQRSIRADMFGSLFYVANWRYIFDSQGYFQLFSAASPLRHMWSLAIEEQFYFVWPLIVYVCVRVARGSTPCARRRLRDRHRTVRLRHACALPHRRPESGVLRDGCARRTRSLSARCSLSCFSSGPRARWRGACWQSQGRWRP